MSKSWRPYAQHILDTITKLRRIEARVKFSDDVILYDAALRNLQTLSEATQHLPQELKNRHAEIPWQQIIGFRNILVQSYLGDIDAQTIQRVVEQFLAPLEQVVRSMLASADEEK